jgi:hypothetical protein
MIKPIQKAALICLPLSLQIAAVSNFEFSEKLFQSTASRYDEKLNNEPAIGKH